MLWAMTKNMRVTNCFKRKKTIRHFSIIWGADVTIEMDIPRHRICVRHIIGVASENALTLGVGRHESTCTKTNRN